MNIFALHEDPRTAVQWYVDRHVVKMLLETAQILCSTHPPQTPTPYKKTHIHHPCVLWAGQTRGNYQWLIRLGEALHQEWQFRFNHPESHQHKSMPVIQWASENPPTPQGDQTPFVQCMPEEFQGPDPIQAYRAFYRTGKAHLHTWTKREPPAWIK